MNWLSYVAGAGGVFLLACLVVEVWIRFSRRMAILDRPTARSSHTRVTPRGGGVGIVLATAGGILVLQWWARAGGAADLLWVGGLALAVAAVSLVDDVRSLSSVVRLVFHLAAAIIAVAALGAFPAATIPGGDAWPLLRWLLPVVTVVWVVGLTNVYNFMDGIDGIAGGQGVIAGLGWTWFGVQMDAPVLAGCGVALSAACAGFLVHNWSPARVFMGDVGSAFLGFAFAVMPLLARREEQAGGVEQASFRDAAAMFALFVVWPFVADGLFTFLRRVRLRQNVLDAHRTHLYQRLVVAGWGHAAVTQLYIAWAVISALLGAGYVDGGPLIRSLTLVSALASLLAVYFVVKAVETAAKKRAGECSV